ncbi:MAG: tRNA (guanosine(37)-N1)-methyltransferase TrmD [Alphaproteobacteria bacterium]|nr:tRNA (guanosine(37)-N1)-methyltransferase TrmD [Alphaproteobacteria bacterium]
MKFTVLTIFPEMFPGYLGCSLAGKALEKGLWNLDVVNIRDFATDKHRSVDDNPFGGGAGMVMKPDVIDRAIKSSHKKGRLIYFTPRGKKLNQDKVKSLMTEENITLLCGRFEGIDQRVFEANNIEEISIGDFILSGGEPAAMILMDAVIRLLPDVMGSNLSLEEESFENGLLEYPLYTRPQNWEGKEVPEVLLSGHHENITKWRLEKAKEITKDKRNDLWEKYIADKK